MSEDNKDVSEMEFGEPSQELGLTFDLTEEDVKNLVAQGAEDSDVQTQGVTGAYSTKDPEEIAKNLDSLLDDEGNMKSATEENGAKEAESVKSNTTALDLEGVSDMASLLEKLPEELTIKHKVDGELVDVKLRDAVKKVLNDFSGHETVDKRFTNLDKAKKELDTERQSWYNERNEIFGTLNKAETQRKEGDVMGALATIFSPIGVKPYELKEQLIAYFGPEVERRYGLEEKELELELIREELEYKRQKEAENSERAQKQAELQKQQDLQDTVTKYRETLGIDEESWNLAFSQLDKELPPNAPITKEMVAEKAQVSKVESKEVSFIPEIVSKFKLNEADEKIVADIVKQYPSFKKEDVEDIIVKSLEEQSKQKVDERLAQKLEKQNPNSQQDDSDEIDPAFIDRLKKIAGVKHEWE